jgi:hypothetical protein
MLFLVAVAVYVAYQYTGLRAWHAVVCLVLGFLLASTGAAPVISSVLTGVGEWFTALLSGGKG